MDLRAGVCCTGVLEAMPGNAAAVVQQAACTRANLARLLATKAELKALIAVERALAGEPRSPAGLLDAGRRPRAPAGSLPRWLPAVPL